MGQTRKGEADAWGHTGLIVIIGVFWFFFNLHLGIIWGLRSPSASHTNTPPSPPGGKNASPGLLLCVLPLASLFPIISRFHKARSFLFFSTLHGWDGWELLGNSSPRESFWEYKGNQYLDGFFFFLLLSLSLASFGRYPPLIHHKSDLDLWQFVFFWDLVFHTHIKQYIIMVALYQTHSLRHMSFPEASVSQVIDAVWSDSHSRPGLLGLLPSFA